MVILPFLTNHKEEETEIIMNSFFCDRSLILKVMNELDAIIRVMMENEVVDKKAVHISIITPGIPFAASTLADAMAYDQAIIVDQEAYKDKYREIAHSKVNMVWREQCDSRIIVAQRPHLLRNGDVVWAGGTWNDGIPVGVSGFRGFRDEFLGNMIAAKIRAEMIGRFERFRTDFKDQSFYGVTTI